LYDNTVIVCARGQSRMYDGTFDGVIYHFDIIVNSYNQNNDDGEKLSGYLRKVLINEE